MVKLSELASELTVTSNDDRYIVQDASTNTVKYITQQTLNGLFKTDYVSVKDFGAVGDGVTDDTVAFQQALNTAFVVNIPVGTYLVGDLLVPIGASLIGGSGRSYNNTILGKTILRRVDGATTILDLSGSRGYILTDFVLDGVNKSCHGAVAVTEDCHQGIIERVSTNKCDIGFGGMGGNILRSTQFRGALATNGNTGYTNLIDCKLTDIVAAANSLDGVKLSTGENSNQFINPRIEWNGGYGFNLFEAQSILIIGGIIDRCYKAAVLYSSTVNCLMIGVALRRNSRNNDVLGSRSHIYIEGTQDGLIIQGIITSTGADDGGTGTVTPQRIIEFNVAEASTDISITGSDLTGFVTSFNSGAFPTDKLLINNNGGVSDIIIGHAINKRDGRSFQAAGILSGINATGTVDDSKTLSVTNYEVSTFSNAFRELKIWARRSDNGADYFVQFNGGISRESGTPSLKLYPVYESSAGTITLNGGAGTIADIAIGNYSSDGSTFDIVVTNNHATATINVGIELT